MTATAKYLRHTPHRTTCGARQCVGSASGAKTNELVAGYMPVGWHFGFIYDNTTAPFVAHELGHGALGLHHTFSDESESFVAPKNSTNNLMDYAGGTALNHIQWQWAHENHGREWFEDEEESEVNKNQKHFVSEHLYKNFFKKNNLTFSDLWDLQELLGKIREKSKRENENLFNVKENKTITGYEIDRCAIMEKFDYQCEAQRTDIDNNDYYEIEKYIWVADYVIKYARELFLTNEKVTNSMLFDYANYFYDKLIEEEKDKKCELMDPTTYVNGSKFDTDRLERDVKEYLLRKDKKYLTARTEKDLAEKSTQYYRLLFIYGYSLYRNKDYKAMQQQFKDYCVAMGEQLKLFSTEWHELTEKERKEWEAKLAGDAKLRKILSASKTQAVKDIVLGGAGVVFSIGCLLTSPLKLGFDLMADLTSLTLSIDQISGGVRMWNAANTKLFDPNKEYKLIRGMIIDDFGDNGAKIYDISNFGVYLKNLYDIYTIKGSKLNFLFELMSAGTSTNDVVDYLKTILNNDQQ